MLMGFREQIHDVGIMKAVGFTDGSVARLMLAQSLLLCGVGGVLGVLLAIGAQAGIVVALGTMFPGYALLRDTVLLALGLSLVIGLIAGIVPSLGARRLACVTALRSVE
jgi:putative ABC transport system permease protein